MACGCGKKTATPTVVPAQSVSSALASSTPQMFDVHGADGSLVASFTNPVTARAESRRIGGTVVPSGTTATPVSDPAGTTSE